MNLSRSITGALALAVSMLASLPATAEMTLDPGTSVTFHHHDLLGSPVMVSDHKGRVLWYENTKPYGESLGKKSSSGLGHLDNTVNEATSNLGYTGHTVDSSTGLVYMKARHYDPVIGRFYSNDPVGFRASNPMMFNRYAYANNNPYYYIDPDGREGTEATTQKNWDSANVKEFNNPLPENAEIANEYLQQTGDVVAATAIGGGGGGVLKALGRLYSGWKAKRAAEAALAAAEAAMIAHAISSFKNGGFTHAGRGLTKHPNVADVYAPKADVQKALMKKYGSQNSINTAAEAITRNMMKNGTRTTKDTKAYGNVTVYKLANGKGVRFQSHTNAFIGFLGRGL